MKDDETLRIYCDHHKNAQVRILKEKAGKSFLKKYFYLGKKHGDKYSIEEYYSTLFEKIKFKKFLKWARKAERKGILIKRYYMEEPIRFKIYRSNDWTIPYVKFCFKWWKCVFEKIFSFFQYNYKTCTFDYYDLFSDLIVKLTIKGIYFSLFGISTAHKEQMHEIWEARKQIIDAYCFDDMSTYKSEKYISDKYNLIFSRRVFDSKIYIDDGEFVPSKIYFNYTIDPNIVRDAFKLDDNTVNGRKKIIEKCDKIETEYSEIEIENFKEKEKTLEKTFEFLGKNIKHWWD